MHLLINYKILTSIMIVRLMLKYLVTDRDLQLPSPEKNDNHAITTIEKNIDTGAALFSLAPNYALPAAAGADAARWLVHPMRDVSIIIADDSGCPAFDRSAIV